MNTTDSITKAIGDKLRQLREAKRLTLKEAEKATGVPFNSMSRWERGVNQPSPEAMRTLAEFYGVTMEEMFLPITEEEHKARVIRQALANLTSEEAKALGLTE